MNRFIFILIVFIAWTLACVFATHIYDSKTIVPKITQGETIWKDKVIYRDYTKLPVNDIVEDLKCYDRSEFKINLKQLNTNKYRVESSLCERSAYKDIEIECGQTESWKYYVGAGIAVAAGIGIYVGLK